MTANLVTRTALRRALADRGVHGDAEPFDDITLDAVVGCEIDVDDPVMCAGVLLDLGPAVVIDALQNGSGWSGFAERIASMLTEVTDVWSPAAREVLWQLHLAGGAAFVTMLRSTAAGPDVDAGVAELAAAGVVRVTYPSAGGAPTGSRVSLRLSRIADAVRESRARLLAGGAGGGSVHSADTMVSEVAAIDLWVASELAENTTDPSRAIARTVGLRRAGLLSVERLATTGHWAEATAAAEALAPPLAAVGLHRALHRRVHVILDGRIPDPFRDRMRAVSAELHLASGDPAVCRHLLNAAGAPDERATRWRAEMLSSVWAVRVDVPAVLAAVERSVRSGGSYTAAAEVTLDLTSRLFGEGRGAEARDVLTACGAYAAVGGDALTLARLHVTEATMHARTGEGEAGRRHLGTAYPLAAAHGDHAFVHVLAACVRPVHAEPGAAGAARIAEVLDLAEAMDGVTVDRRRILADVVADAGAGVRGTAGLHAPAGSAVSASTMLRSLFTAPGRAGSAAHGDHADHERLTDREQQVAELVSIGLGNNEIGDRLGISRWTVVSHLRNIMRKWDCTSRVEVALRYRDPGGTDGRAG